MSARKKPRDRMPDIRERYLTDQPFAAAVAALIEAVEPFHDQDAHDVLRMAIECRNMPTFVEGLVARHRESAGGRDLMPGERRGDNEALPMQQDIPYEILAARASIPRLWPLRNDERHGADARKALRVWLRELRRWQPKGRA